MQRISVDARTKLITLFAVNFFIFTNSNHYYEVAVIGGLALLLCYYQLWKAAIGSIVFYLITLCLIYIIMPILPDFILSIFGIILVSARRLLPCYMLGTFIINTTPIRILIYSLQLWHIPTSISLPIAISIRYFPELREDKRAIKNAMKLRNINSIPARLKYMYGPMMVTASNIADDLSSAIITRGIENPNPKTFAAPLKFSILDFLLWGISIVLAFLTILSFF